MAILNIPHKMEIFFYRVLTNAIDAWDLTDEDREAITKMVDSLDRQIRKRLDADQPDRVR